ncbi:MAG: OmpH family outer membrane protein [Alphaproteobacteria bacterium]|nr:OmpH family outer membrane protein [Alphaproteobacteria bacterium]
MARWISAAMIAVALLFTGPMAGTAMAADAAKAKSGTKIKAKAELGDLVIAVLDVQQVLRRAAAAKGINEAMEARRKAFEQEVTVAQEFLKNEETKLRQQSTILSPEAMNEKRRVLENKFSDSRRKAEQSRGILNRAMTGATRKLRQEIAKVVAELMAEKKITITLARKAVLVFDQRLNISDEVLKRLDKRLPNVTVDFTKPGVK